MVLGDVPPSDTPKLEKESCHWTSTMSHDTRSMGHLDRNGPDLSHDEEVKRMDKQETCARIESLERARVVPEERMNSK